MALNPNSFRRGAIAAAAIAGASLLATFSAAAQDAQKASQQVATNAPQTASLAAHCDDIKDVFALAKFNGEYRKRADAFVADGCKGNVPMPRDGDAYNTRRLNTSAYVLHAGGIELN
jgi:hypothetical protein